MGAIGSDWEGESRRPPAPTRRRVHLVHLVHLVVPVSPLALFVRPSGLQESVCGGHKRVLRTALWRPLRPLRPLPTAGSSPGPDGRCKFDADACATVIMSARAARHWVVPA